MKKSVKQGVTFKEKLIYSLGTLGKEVSNGMINTYAMLYLTVFVGLNGIAVGFAFCFVKLLTAVADPFMATLVNNTKSKLGKFRPWLLVGGILNAVTLLALFIQLPSGAAIGYKYFYYLLIYLLWGLTYTIIDVPIMSMVPSIADSTHERESVSSLSRLIGGFGGFIIGSGGALVIALAYGNQNDVRGYFLVAAVAGVLLTVMLGLMVATLKERYKLPCQEVKIKEIFSLFKRNDQVRAYTGSYLFFTVAANIAILQIIYLFIYDTARLDLAYYIVFQVVSCTGTGLAMMFYTAITKKIPREKVCGLTYILSFIGMALLFAAFFVLGDNKLVNVIILSLAGSLLMTANGVNQVCSMVMITDVVDYGEYKLGIRSDAIMISVQTLLMKVASALAMLVLGIGIAVSGLPTINLLDNTFSGEVTEKMLWILRAFMFLVPLPLMPIGYFFYKKKYKLHGDYYKDIKKSIDENRAIAEE